MKKSELISYVDSLFTRAYESSPFDFLCTILRVHGLSDANWDPFEESLDAFEDFNWLMGKSNEERDHRCTLRIALLVYCQTIEMTAVHEMLANLLRCISNEPYIINPFSKLIKLKKKRLFDWIPPSAPVKFNVIKKLATKVGDETLPRIIDSFLNGDVRNAFSHSDYILTDTEFRFTEAGLAHVIKIDEIDRLINECVAFYNTFISTHKQWRLNLGRSKRFHKLPDYDVLELLSDDKEGVYGYHVHSSNGSKSTYSRKRSGTEARNMGFNSDGTIYFWMATEEKLEPIWKVNGEPIEDWEALEARNKKK